MCGRTRPNINFECDLRTQRPGCVSANWRKCFPCSPIVHCDATHPRNDTDHDDVRDVPTLSQCVDNIFVCITGYVIRMKKPHITCLAVRWVRVLGTTHCQVFICFLFNEITKIGFRLFARALWWSASLQKATSDVLNPAIFLLVAFPNKEPLRWCCVNCTP